MECPGLFCLTVRRPEGHSEKGWIPIFWRTSFLAIPINHRDSRETSHVRGDRGARDHVPDFKEDMAG
jgi:hypothetical protein